MNRSSPPFFCGFCFCFRSFGFCCGFSGFDSDGLGSCGFAGSGFDSDGFGCGFAGSGSDGWGSGSGARYVNLSLGLDWVRVTILPGTIAGVGLESGFQSFATFSMTSGLETGF